MDISFCWPQFKMPYIIERSLNQYRPVFKIAALIRHHRSRECESPCFLTSSISLSSLLSPSLPCSLCLLLFLSLPSSSPSPLHLSSLFLHSHSLSLHSLSLSLPFSPLPPSYLSFLFFLLIDFFLNLFHSYCIPVMC